MESNELEDSTIIAVRQSDGQFCAEVTRGAIDRYVVCECDSFGLESGHVIRASFRQTVAVYGLNLSTGKPIRIQVRSRHTKRHSAMRELKRVGCRPVDDAAPTRDSEDEFCEFADWPNPSLDGAAGYWDAYREKGRFGSHPSHDDYDDEAAP